MNPNGSSLIQCSQLRLVFLVQALAQGAAEASAQARRGPELGELPTEPSRHGVFAWLEDGPRRGAVCHLAYNKNASEIRWAASLIAALCLNSAGCLAWRRGAVCHLVYNKDASKIRLSVRLTQIMAACFMCHPAYNEDGSQIRWAWRLLQAVANHHDSGSRAAVAEDRLQAGGSLELDSPLLAIWRTGLCFTAKAAQGPDP